MKHLLLLLVFLFTITASAQAPTKLFDIRNGDGAAIGTDTYPSATIIAYQDAAAKTEVIDASVQADADFEAQEKPTKP